ncbi:MAG: PIG-L family deacetylase [Acidimicrobiales bacterium]|nr:PIG-L family deacetylase [Acidimicrobiales bacterium]
MTAPLSPAALGTILSIWAHPDDESFLAAGVMAAARDGGQRVVCVSATAGEHGTDDAVTWPPDRLGRVRRWEAAAAMAVLGVGEHAIRGLPDGDLPGRDDEGLAWAGGLLDEVRPDTILTFGPEGMTYHPDHIAVHRWVTEAWERADRPGRLLYATMTVEQIARFGDLYEEWGIYMTEERPAGTPERDLALHLRLAGAALDRKLTALRAMTTQTGDVFAQVDLARFEAEIATESFVAAGGASRAP